MQEFFSPTDFGFAFSGDWYDWDWRRNVKTETERRAMAIYRKFRRDARKFEAELKERLDRKEITKRQFRRWAKMYARLLQDH